MEEGTQRNDSLLRSFFSASFVCKRASCTNKEIKPTLSRELYFFRRPECTYEHQQFLDWLLVTLTTEKIDVLLVSGDVFDLSNPSAASIKMFYSFLNQAVKRNPQPEAKD
jgi:hypothetical protein